MTSGTGPLPHFVFVGPKRTGTTWIHAYLRGVSGVRLPTGTKETMYFDRFHDRGLDWYRSLYDLPAPPSSRIGEVAPSYFHVPEAPGRIAAASSDSRIVVTLRHPRERLVSLYFHHQRSGTVPGSMPLGVALRERPFLLESSRYATHTRRWLDRFGEGVTVLFHDDLAADPEAFAARVTDAIGVPPAPVPDELRERSIGEGELPMSFAVARATQRAAGWLRAIGAYRLLRLGRRLGKRALTGGRPLPSDPPPIPEWALDVLREETEGLTELPIHAPRWDL